MNTKFRILGWALCVALVCTFALAKDDGDANRWLNTNQKQALSDSVPPPPAPDSAEDQADRAQIIHVQATRTDEMIAEARRDQGFSYLLFQSVYGKDLTPENSPKFYQLLKDVTATTRVVNETAKNKYKRLRPYQGHPEVVKALFPVNGYSYPSGHAMGSFTLATVLSAVFPDKKQAFFARRPDCPEPRQRRRPLSQRHQGRRHPRPRHRRSHRRHHGLPIRPRRRPRGIKKSPPANARELNAAGSHADKTLCKLTFIVDAIYCLGKVDPMPDSAPSPPKVRSGIILVRGGFWLCFLLGLSIQGRLLAASSSPPPQPPPPATYSNLPPGLPAYTPPPAFVTPQDAGPLFQRNLMTGDWDGFRKTLQDNGLQVSPTYYGEVFGNPSGGASKGVVYDGLLDIELDFDLAKMSGGGVDDLTFHANALYLHGAGLSQHFVGDFSTTSNIAGYNSVRLQELWLQKGFFDHRLTIKIGNIAIDTEFFQSSSSSLFINSTFAGFTLFSDNIPNPPVYPTASPGVRIEFLPTPKFYLMAGVFGMDDESKLNFDNKYGTDFALDSDSGMLVLSEAGYLLNQGPKDSGLQGTYRLGSFVHTANYDTWGSQADNALGTGPLQGAGTNYGVYAIMDQQLQTHGDRPSASSFARAARPPTSTSSIGTWTAASTSPASSRAASPTSPASPSPAPISAATSATARSCRATPPSPPRPTSKPLTKSRSPPGGFFSPISNTSSPPAAKKVPTTPPLSASAPPSRFKPSSRSHLFRATYSS